MFLFKQPLPTAKPSYVEEKLKPFSLSTPYEDKVSGGSDNVNPGLKMKPLCTNYVLTFKYFLRKNPCLLAIIGELIVLDFCGVMHVFLVLKESGDFLFVCLCF